MSKSRPGRIRGRSSSSIRPLVPTDDYVSARSPSVRETPSIWTLIHHGSFPELQDARTDWSAYYADYVKTYLERDVRSLKAVHDLTAFRQFMVAMASRTAQVLNYSNIADEIGKDVGTVKSWTSILETSGIVYLLQPYAAGELKRAIRAPKLHFRDMGLVAYLTRWLTPEALACGAMAGPVFESFVVSEILKEFSNEGLEYRDFVSYYRSREKVEIDLLIEENGVLYPIEIKKSSTPQASDARAFPVLDRIKSKTRGTGAIICNCAVPLHLRDNLIALPVGYL